MDKATPIMRLIIVNASRTTLTGSSACGYIRISFIVSDNSLELHFSVPIFVFMKNIGSERFTVLTIK